MEWIITTIVLLLFYDDYYSMSSVGWLVVRVVAWWMLLQPNRSVGFASAKVAKSIMTDKTHRDIMFW